MFISENITAMNTFCGYFCVSCLFDVQQGIFTHFEALEEKVFQVLGRVLKFAGYVHHYKSLPRNIIDLI